MFRQPSANYHLLLRMHDYTFFIEDYELISLLFKEMVKPLLSLRLPELLFAVNPCWF